jgi:SpoVK/Ycf46/Vps4 family AAA+-type ATPase
MPLTHMTDQQRFDHYLTARHACIAITSYEEEYVLQLARHSAADRGWDMWLWSVTRGVRDGLLDKAPVIADTEHPAGALTYLVRERANRSLFVMLDLLGHLKDERTMRALRDAIQHLDKCNCTLVLIDQNSEIPPVLGAMATRFDISYPDETEIEKLLRSTLRELHDEQRIGVSMSRQGLSTVIRNLRGLGRRQVKQIIMDVVSDDRRFDDSDINHILASKRRLLSRTGLLEYIESPATLDQIGGLKRLKTWLAQRQGALSEEAVQFGIPAPGGVLMLGVQGAGKSLSAKAVASAWQRPLLRMDVGALYDKYIGESERRLRDALHQAEMMAPIILWIDEIEKAFASAGQNSNDGGLSKRMFGSLLTWMQEHEHPVFLIATANDIESLPPELLRKGRFDEIFFVDLPNLEARHAIFRIHLKKRGRDPKSFDIAGLCEAADGFSGAEIEQAIVSAMYNAFSSKNELTSKHIFDALRDCPPLSITMAERIADLRAWAQGRCVPAD